jgi:hypothetical protein
MISVIRKGFFRGFMDALVISGWMAVGCLFIALFEGFGIVLAILWWFVSAGPIFEKLAMYNRASLTMAILEAYPLPVKPGCEVSHTGSVIQNYLAYTKNQGFTATAQRNQLVRERRLPFDISLVIGFATWYALFVSSTYILWLR